MTNELIKISNPYVKDGYITDIDKHTAWLEATGWEMCDNGDEDDTVTYKLVHQ